jgi:hypothetical protein
MSEYDTDFVLWSREQADLLRRIGAGERLNDRVDWDNVAEEDRILGQGRPTRPGQRHSDRPQAFD